MKMQEHLPVETISPHSFEMERHYYSKVLNAQLHPLVSFFMSLSRERLVHRYCHLHPRVQGEKLLEILAYQPQYIPWAGSDLFHVTTERGNRKMVIIETNSCPSGQKSFPLLHEHQDHGGYARLIEKTFVPLVQQRKKRLPPGKLAVFYDKNYMEASGYAAAMADVFQEEVLLVPCFHNQPRDHIRLEKGVFHVQDTKGSWHSIRAAFRYVTQKPWNRIPVQTKTFILNPILACLAGGRNKMLASKAYDIYNGELFPYGLMIETPKTIRDVSKAEVPLWLQRFGGYGVVKNPYSNAGQGVYIITNEKELAEFMSQEYEYDQFIVQSLIGNYRWSTLSEMGVFYHVGTMPDKKNNIFVADLRFMVGSSPEGFYPLAIYSRKSRVPLSERLDGTHSPWDMLGTNLSFKRPDGSWDTDTKRLLLMDRKDFNLLGIGLDDLIDAYIQTVLSVVAIDKMAHTLVTTKGKFRKKLFRSLNRDEKLLQEIVES